MSDQAANLRLLAAKARGERLRPVVVASSVRDGGGLHLASGLVEALQAAGQQAAVIDLAGGPCATDTAPSFRGPGGKLDVAFAELARVISSGYAVLNSGTIPLDFGIDRLPAGAVLLLLSRASREGAMGTYAICKVAFGVEADLRAGLVVTGVVPDDAARFVAKLNGVLWKFLGRNAELLACFPSGLRGRRDAFLALASKVASLFKSQDTAKVGG